MTKGGWNAKKEDRKGKKKKTKKQKGLVRDQASLNVKGTELNRDRLVAGHARTFSHGRDESHLVEINKKGIPPVFHVLGKAINAEAERKPPTKKKNGDCLQRTRPSHGLKQKE